MYIILNAIFSLSIELFDNKFNFFKDSFLKKEIIPIVRFASWKRSFVELLGFSQIDPKQIDVE